jgi:hypothetical protein
MGLRNRMAQDLPDQDTDAQVAADMALERSTQALCDQVAQRPEVHRVVGSLRELRETNHFAEMIEASMRRRRTRPRS